MSNAASLTTDTIVYDAVIVGGGAAGLSAALILGRARRDVLVIDDAHPRNAVVDFSHGFFTRDGERPGTLSRIARDDLAAYPTVNFRDEAAVGVRRTRDIFNVTVASGATVAGKRLLLATGVFDQLPQIEGLQDRWGKSIFVCPFCDGWELRDQRIAVWGKRRDAVELAQEIYGWTHDVVVCVENDDLTDDDRLWARAANVPLKTGRLLAISGSDTNVLAFEDGSHETCAAVFLSSPLRQHSPLFAQIGCKIGDDGLVVVDPQYRTSVEHCYAAGDSVTLRHQILIAAASGAAAAITLNCNLLESEAAELAATAGEENS